MTARRSTAAMMVAVIVLFASCDAPFGGQPLVVELEESRFVSMSISPESADPVEYRVRGAGPDGATFTRSVSDLPITVHGLTSGEWRIAVEGVDGAGNVVLEGSGVAFVSNEHIRLTKIALAPPSGNGSVRIELSWPAELVTNPRPEAILHVGDTPVASLDCSVLPSGGTATCTAGTIASGWYRLELQLYDLEQSVAGRADLLSIVAGSTTEAALALPRLNKPGRLIPISGPSFQLAWDADEPNPDDPVTHYRVYYRENGTYLWNYLGSTDGATERFAVSTAVLAYGTYDFAVTAVTASGAQSEPHTSRCDDADPQTGWYVGWSP